MKSIILSLLVAVSLTACTSPGKKVSITGSKGEVYYKGDGVTEADAQKLGAYLKDNLHYFNETDKKSVVLKKGEGGAYEIRFATSEEQLKAAPTVADEFKKIGAAISIEVFNNVPVNVVFVNSKDKELQALPFDKEVASQLQQMLNQAKQDTAAESTMPPAEEPATHTEDTTTHSNQ